MMKHAVLIVDDEVDILEETFEALADEGYRAHCASSVNEALKILQQHRDISLVVTDLKMPGRSGADLIREVRQGLRPEMLFIVMSGHGGRSMSSDKTFPEDIACLKKPLSIAELIEAVEKTLRQNAV